MAQQTKKAPETPRKGRTRQPSTSDEEGTAATSLQEEPTGVPPSLQIQLSQLTQAVATLQAKMQQQAAPLPPSPSRAQRQRMATPDSASRRRLLSPEPDLEWESLRDDRPAGPPGDLEDDSKIYKLAREDRRLGKLMSAGRDLHDINTVIHLVSYWPDLQESTRNYTQHRLRLLYLAATRGWPAAIYFDTHGSDEFIPAELGFWAGYQQQPRSVTAQRASRTRVRSATRKGRGSRQR